MLGAGLGAGLVLLHAGLLWRRLADGTLLDPHVAAQWVATTLLVAGALVLRRRGGSWVRGRRAAAFWILLLLLHGLVALPGGPGFAGLLLAEPWLVAAPLGTTLIVVLLVSLRLFGPARRPAAQASLVQPAGVVRLWRPLAAEAPRPPPA